MPNHTYTSRNILIKPALLSLNNDKIWIRLVISVRLLTCRHTVERVALYTVRAAENAGVENAGVENTGAITYGKPSNNK